MPHRVFSLQEVAAYLHLTTGEVEKLVKRGEIPHELRADKPYFRRIVIDEWMSHRLLGATGRAMEDFHKKSSHQHRKLDQHHAIMPELLKPSGITPSLESRTRASVLADMTDLAMETGAVNSRADLLESLRRREQMCSTALSGGIALLHPRHHTPHMFTESFVVLGRTMRPIPFGAPDGMLTDLFFLLACEDERLHLHTISRVCVLCYQTDVIAQLREAGTSQAIFDALVAAEYEVLAKLR